MFFVCLPTEHLGVELKRVRAFQAVPDRTGTWKCSFLRRGEKSGVPGKSLSEQGRGPTTNSTHMVLICEFFFNSHDGYKIDQVMNEMGVNASESDIEILKQVCAAVSIRAARLAAAGIAAIIKVC